MNNPISDIIPVEGRPNLDRIVQRRMSAVTILHRKGALEARHKLAADRLYADYMIGERGVMELSDDRLPGGGDPWSKGGLSERRMIALGAYKRAVKAMGKTVAELVVPAAVLDLGMEEMRKILGMDRRKAIGALYMGLSVLADHYGIATNAVTKRETLPKDDAA